MDVYLEYLVKKKLDSIGVMKITGLYFAAFAVSVFLLLFAMQIQFLGQFVFLLIFGAFYGAWWLSARIAVEYEYIYTNGELDIDRIIAKRSRKRMLTVAISKFEVMGKAQGPEFESAFKDPSIRIKLDASGTTKNFDDYFAVFYNKDGQKMLLIFTPTTKMLEEMKRYNPFKINL